MPDALFNPSLTTARLLLRQPTLADAPDLFALRTHEQVNRYLDRPQPTSIEAVEAFIDRLLQGIASEESLYWSIVLLPSDKVIGTLCLWNFSHTRQRAEVGFELHPDYQKQGLMREALRKVLAFAFEQLQLEAVEGWTHQKNQAAIKLMQGLGFQKDESDKTDLVLGRWVLISTCATT